MFLDQRERELGLNNGQVLATIGAGLRTLKLDRSKTVILDKECGSGM